ncbi:2-methylaconitate cis-trans isomerase PrpF family protein [Variovorax paradoxus]|uniref:2-methylaconitate cis-trans isomerase PrpF family protein n=1 Tax=Variovorax paradoxus TaxID=34073 RepID=UPI0029C9A5C4|nr:PrpF domain-containing protein [Variovorax paradoxus]
MTPFPSHGRLPAVFMRGGTSKALVFHARDLPTDRALWAPLFLSAMGSPDPHGRQLDGMGGGVTSLSKVCVIGPPTRGDADVDYSFFQVLVREARVAENGNCGNMSAAIGPFAVDEGLVQARGHKATVRIHNTNTRKIIRATFPLHEGRAAIDGKLRIPGVTGSGAPVRLDFLDPGGAATGALLPSGSACEHIDVPGVGRLEVSIVDAANLCMFVAASDLGLAGTELPQVLEDDAAALERCRAAGAAVVLSLGLAADAKAARSRLPLIALVSPPVDAPTLSGETIEAGASDLCIRMLSSGQPHRALPATGAVCTAVAMGVPGSIPQRLARAAVSGAPRRLSMPSGVITVDADVGLSRGREPAPHAGSGTLYRTARRLFDGHVYY